MMSNNEINKDLIAKRLSEIFQGESQTVIAKKLNTSQSNVSKWITGDQLPTTDCIISISKLYKVSVDWLIGLSDKRDINDIDYEKLTYEQAARVLDFLIKKGSIEVPDLATLRREGKLLSRSNDMKYNPDYYLIKDRALSHLLRRRFRFSEMEIRYLNLWQETTLDPYKGIKMLDYDDNIDKAIDSKNWSSFNDGDWAELINEFHSKKKGDKNGKQ